MSFTIRSAQVEDIPAIIDTFTTALGFEMSPAHQERFAAFIEIDRFRVACDGGRIVATFGAHSLPMTVPGNSLPMSGITVVTTLPTHRRRGILRQLMTEHLNEIRTERREPLAGLWASEGSIYQRFGFGVASERTRWRIPKPYAQLRPAIDESQSAPTAWRLEHWDRSEAVQRLPELYNAAQATRVGMFARRPVWWEKRVLCDPPGLPGGISPPRRVVLLDGETPRGYAIYRTRRPSLDVGLEVHVQELVSRDPREERPLWDFLFSIDLVDTIEYWNVATDHPLRFWLRDIRKCERQVHDGLWLRIVDVPVALSARRYSGAGALKVAVVDPLCPWNQSTWYLASDEEGRAEVRSTDGSADLQCTIEGLSVVYLGGLTWTQAAAAGLMNGPRETLALADQLFHTPSAPWCPERF